MPEAARWGEELGSVSQNACACPLLGHGRKFEVLGPSQKSEGILPLHIQLWVLSMMKLQMTKLISWDIAFPWVNMLPRACFTHALNWVTSVINCKNTNFSMLTTIAQPHTGSYSKEEITLHFRVSQKKLLCHQLSSFSFSSFSPWSHWRPRPPVHTMLLASVDSSLPRIKQPCSSMAALHPDTIKTEGERASRKANCVFLLLGSPLLALQDTEVES